MPKQLYKSLYNSTIVPAMNSAARPTAPSMAGAWQSSEREIW